jgi:TonB family protein
MAGVFVYMRVLGTAVLGAILLIGPVEAGSSEKAPTEPCSSAGPLLTDGRGNAAWFSTGELIRKSTHCIAPRLPALLLSARFEGYVLVDVLINEKGHVDCVQLISGNPLVAVAAVKAAREWIFRPERQNGRPVSFSGHLRFHFSTSPVPDTTNACTEAHW